MYELSRVRLFSVGPPGARYQDVCLDFRGIGAVVRTAVQSDLFPADAGAETEPPRRPSPASVLFLENGGGKSVLLKLIFSVLLPGRRQVVGTTNSRVLEKFVLGDDVAHVALEWMHTKSGERIVTGKVSEWRGHVVSTDPAKLIDAWYSFRPGPGLGLDELPFAVGNRRVTMAGFKERLDEAQGGRPGLALVWETVHRDWSAHLIQLGLDPELFRYQRAMNAGEGEAAEAFAFPSDEAFVDFLLRAVVDQEEPRGLAEVVAGYAAKIAQRAELELEREFVAGTLDRLSPLAEAERRAEEGRELERTARRAAGELSAALAARRVAEEERLATARSVLTEATRAEQETGVGERRLQDVCTELRRRVAELRHRVAEDARDALRERVDEADELVAAWQAVEPVLREELATAEAARLRRVVADEQRKAEPALAARQAAALALAGALRRVTTAAEEEARAATVRAEAAREEGRAARDDELRHTREAAEHRSSADQARTEIGRIRARVAEAAGAGLLEAEEDVAEATRRAEEAERTACAAVEHALDEQRALRAARRTAEQSLATARAEHGDRRAEAEAAEQRWRRADGASTELAAESRLAELLGADEVRPDRDASALLDRLAAAITGQEEERIELRAAQRRDLQAVAALGEGGLLPEPGEVREALAALEAAGIAAHSGWRYLAGLPEADRAGVLDRLGHLVAGVLLNDPADASRAREALADARLLPCAIVAVGASRALHEVSGAAAGVDFVVPPNPAMFDEAAAERTRAELTEETDRRRERMAALDARWEADRALLERLRAFAAEYPPGRPEELADAHRDAVREVETAGERVTGLTEELAGSDTRSDELEAALPRMRAEENTARTAAARLATLRAEVGRRPELTDRVREHTEAAEQADARAATAREMAEQADRDAHEQVRVADRAAATVATACDELAQLPTDVAGVAAEQPESEHPLGVLRAEYRRADAAYAAAEVDADLRATLRAAEREAEAARAAVTGLPDPVRRRADGLLRSPDGSDVASRRAAEAQAVRVLRELRDRQQAAHTEVAMARSARDQYRPQRVSLDPYGPPEDIEHGDSLVARADRDRIAAEAAAGQARARRETAAAAERETARLAEGFGQLVAGLDELAPTSDSVSTAFVGDLDVAVDRLKATRAALREAASAGAAGDDAVRRAADDVAKHAQDARYGGVTSPVRRHILGVSRAEMPPLAGEWATALRPRLRSLTDDLTNIGRHRSGIVTRLRGMVGEALRTLRLAGRLSQLPDGLSDWSGQQFLRIRFDELDDDALLEERLGEVVDRTAEGYLEGAGAAAREQRDGMSLLLRGVRAAMPKGVRVEMLKPDAVLRTERLRVSEIRDVFSGGQQLTAAIVLYCTMAALRANQRGEGRRPHAGVLFLDNPIGRASAGYLLELQFGVAEALGVQLVYTTGLFDAGALSTFPLVIRLRNDADLRAGRKYLSVDDQIARRLDELPPSDGTGRLAAVRVFRRPERAGVNA